MIGQYRSVLYGGILIMLGHLSLVFQALPFFYTGLALIVIGTGLLKPSVSTLVGSLYPQGDPRRDAGFSIFYMGINSGAMLGPIIAGYVAQRIDWHLGFGCAAIGMALGLVQYVLDKRHLQPAIARMAEERRMRATAAPVTRFHFSARLWRRPGLHAPVNGVASAPSSCCSSSRSCSGLATKPPDLHSRSSPIATPTFTSSDSSSPRRGSRLPNRSL